jgi:hypothetical protein
MDQGQEREIEEMEGGATIFFPFFSFRGPTTSISLTLVTAGTGATGKKRHVAPDSCYQSQATV